MVHENDKRTFIISSRYVKEVQIFNGRYTKWGTFSVKNACYMKGKEVGPRGGVFQYKTLLSNPIRVKKGVRLTESLLA